MTQQKTRQLKLTSHVTHILAGGGDEINTALRELCGLGLREIAAIADHDAVPHPPGERIEQLAIIDRGRSQLKAAESSCLIALDVEFKAEPPAHPVLGFARPVAKRAVLPRP